VHPHNSFRQGVQEAEQECERIKPKNGRQKDGQRDQIHLQVR
jgi:hypothetical protein